MTDAAPDTGDKPAPGETAAPQPSQDPPLVVDRGDGVAPRATPKSPRTGIGPADVPPPPIRKTRSKAARNSIVVFLSGFFTFVTLVLVGAGLAVYLGRQDFFAEGPLAENKLVVIPQRSGLDEIAGILSKAGVISNDFVFSWGTRLSGQADRLKAGEYEFKPGLSMREVADMLVEGKVVLHSITFPEGWTSEQIVARLLDDPILTGKINSIPEEGSLMPDTYKFERGRTREQIIGLMKNYQERRLAEIWAKRVDGLPLASPRELVILASIVEKETGKAEERARVAGVFVNRLKKNMRLETDPTILYGLYGGKAWTVPRTITRAELNAPNPYNTYKINGLPPGPIGNPGRAAMEAVANPARHNELFFVADGTGGHVFAETFEEHNKNVQRWRQVEASRRGEGSPVVTVPAAAAETKPAPGQPPGPARATGQPNPAGAATRAPTGGAQPRGTQPPDPAAPSPQVPARVN